MSQMPDFDPDPASLELPASKKPRRKPTRRKAAKIAAPKSARKTRKRRAVKRIAPAANGHGGRFTPEVYRLIGQLMEMAPASRNLVIGIVRGLTK